MWKLCGKIVRVQHVNEQPLSGLGVEHRARHPAIEPRLVDVGRRDRRRIWNRERRIQVLAIHDGVELALLDLGMRNVRVLVRRIAHAVATMLVVFGIVWRDGTVRRDPLDLEVDVPAPIGRLRNVTSIAPAVGVPAPSAVRASHHLIVIVFVFMTVAVTVVMLVYALAVVALFAVLPGRRWFRRPSNWPALHRSSPARTVRAAVRQFDVEHGVGAALDEFRERRIIAGNLEPAIHGGHRLRPRGRSCVRRDRTTRTRALANRGFRQAAAGHVREWRFGFMGDLRCCGPFDGWRRLSSSSARVVGNW